MIIAGSKKGSIPLAVPRGTGMQLNPFGHSKKKSVAKDIGGLEEVKPKEEP